MSKSSGRSVIRLRGVRHNNLKNFDLDLPLNRLIVVTGLSGSGKSSLAFDTLFAEGQRRYIETFSPYARQFLDRMDKPRVDSIEGIPPAIAIEQRNAVRTTRSTVGTMTEICEFMKTLWPAIARLHCRRCGRRVTRQPPRRVWEAVRGAGEALVTFDLPLSEKLSLAESLTLVARQGYQRVLINGAVARLDELAAQTDSKLAPRGNLTVIQDRLPADETQRRRFIEACEQAYHFGKGKLTVFSLDPTGTRAREPRPFSEGLHCAECDLEYRPASPALFSFNHPLGACPACKGFGRVIRIDYQRALPNRSRTLAEGVVKPWLTGAGAECQADLLRACRKLDIPTKVPFERLPKQWRDFVIEGDPDYGKDEEHEWPRVWYGVKGYFRWLESKAYKMHVRVLLSRYRAYTTCPDCQGRRLQPDALLYRAPAEFRPGEGGDLTLADFYQLPIRDALEFVERAARALAPKPNEPLGLALQEVTARLAFLNQAGLGYLTLDRPTRSLSGGETERVNLTTCLGSRLVNTLFVLDEPSVGLHPRDTERLVRILERLRDAGNTVLVVEHEARVMRAADQIIDLGPGHGATGGQVVFQGSYAEILREKKSLTGRFLSGAEEISLPIRRPVAREPAPRSGEIRGVALLSGGALHDRTVPCRAAPAPVEFLRLSQVTRHNLREVSVEIPLRRFVCVTGVSGSGKTTLVREALLPLLAARLGGELAAESKASDRLETPVEENGEAELAETAGALEGGETLRQVSLVDQSILAKTPRSNPAVYIGAFDWIREVFAHSEIARQHGLNASAFSFNSSQGQCERCRGAGFEKIEMQFLSDVFIRCPECNGRRYRPHILEVKIQPDPAGASWSIADVLEATAEEAAAFLSGLDLRAARQAARSLRLLDEVGLGYLQLGQPLNTLSGGESQRLKLVRHLAAQAGSEPTLFLFDEPTTGLHFADVRVLLKVFQRLVAAGHSVVVIEHNLDVIKSADWLIDLGPEAGDGGGRVVAAGAPEAVAAVAASHTGQALKAVLPREAASGRARRPAAGWKGSRC